MRVTCVLIGAVATLLTSTDAVSAVMTSPDLAHQTNAAQSNVNGNRFLRVHESIDDDESEDSDEERAGLSESYLVLSTC